MKLAADAIERGAAARDFRAAQLLEALDYGSLLSQTKHLATSTNEFKLLRFVERFDALFRLDAPHAPGLAFFGGLLSDRCGALPDGAGESVSVTGRGMTLKAAFEGCVGEAVEYASQWECEGDAFSIEDPETALASLDPVAGRELRRWLAASQRWGRPLQWLDATRLSDGAAAKLPADFCLRRDASRRAMTPPFLLGSGAAAGATGEAATLHAVFELIERDALGLWWRGGQRGYAVDPASSQFDLTLGALRRDRRDRQTWLIDITSDIGAPCVVAVSCAPNGEDFAFGAAARGTLAAAARVALLEVCQMELAYDIVQKKIDARGEDALNAADRRHLARASAINAKTCELVRPVPELRTHAEAPQALSDIIRRASRLGVEFYRVDLTRAPEFIPAVRVLAPAMQPEPSQLESERLRAVIEMAGGGDAYTGGAPLL